MEKSKIMTLPTALPAIIYLRISRDREGAGLGVERQREDCEALAERLGYRVVAVYEDNDMSAYSGKPRPGYRQLLSDLEAGQAKAVLAWHTDRLHRSPAELEEYISVCEPRGIVTHTVKAGLIDLATASGRMMARQLGAVARFESEHKSDRARRKRDQMAKAGQWKGGRRPFGYEKDGVTIRQEEADALKAAVEAILSGVSMHAIARRWNERGIKTATGGTWTPTSVRNVVLRPRNAGLMEHHGEEVGRANWKGILDETTWRGVVALLADPKRRTTPGPSRRWQGSGVYECGVCVEAGEKRTYLICGTAGMRIEGSRSTVPAYRCAEGRDHVARYAVHLDKYVSKVVVEWLSTPAAAQALATPLDRRATQERALEREALRHREKEAAEMHAAGQMTKAQFLVSNQFTSNRLAELDQADAAVARASALAPFTMGEEASSVWDALDVDRRRAVISEIMRVIVMPTKKGRPPGWTPEYGKEWGYFNPNAIRIERRNQEGAAGAPGSVVE